MKVPGYVCGALLVVCLVGLAESTELLDGTDPRLVESYESEGKMKRPFCNAFTGCGRKRNSVGVPQFPEAFPNEASETVQLPFPVYKALLRAVSRKAGNPDAGRRQEPAPLADFRYSRPEVAFLTRKTQARQIFGS